MRAMSRRGKVIPFPRSPTAPSPAPTFTEVRRCRDQGEALVVRGLLESRGIGAVLRSNIAQSVHPFSVGDQGEVIVLVADRDALRGVIRNVLLLQLVGIRPVLVHGGGPEIDSLLARLGMKCAMEPGDLIVTPPMRWHDHGHEGTEPVVWLDGLDIPLVRSMDASWASRMRPAAPPTTSTDSSEDELTAAGLVPRLSRYEDTGYPQVRWPWRTARKALATLAETAPAAAPDGRQREAYSLYVERAVEGRRTSADGPLSSL